MSSKRDIIVAQALKVIEQYTTRLTVRQIYYRLVSAHTIENRVSEYQAVVNALTYARLNGVIDYSSIEDRTRAFIGGDHSYESPEQHFNDAKRYFETSSEYFQYPLWMNQPNYVEVWLEKQALAALFEQVTNKYKVRLAPCRGYPSLTFLWEGAEHLKRIQDREIKILYFGDFDPSGLDIPRYIESRFTNDLGISTENMSFGKIAITAEQIEKYDIPPMPVKMTDSRGAAFAAEHGANSAVELDAIEPNVLQDIIKNAIVHFMDGEILEARNAAQVEAQELIKGMIKDSLGRERLPTKQAALRKSRKSKE
jgi:hypothetical protein